MAIAKAVGGLTQFHQSPGSGGATLRGVRETCEKPCYHRLVVGHGPGEHPTGSQNPADRQFVPEPTQAPERISRVTPFPLPTSGPAHTSAAHRTKPQSGSRNSWASAFRDSMVEGKIGGRPMAGNGGSSASKWVGSEVDRVAAAWHCPPVRGYTSRPMTRPPASADVSKAPPKPRRRDPRGTRERVARAALELFTTHGYHPSTTPQIADRAGVAEGTIYRHFQSKEQLLNEIYRSAVRLFTDVVRESPAADTCRERTAAIAVSWREVAARDPALVKLVFVSPPHGLLDAKSRETYQELRTELERVIASGKSSGEVRAGPVGLWTDVWLQLVTLTLGRVADNEWAPDHSAPRLVDESAWDAVAARANVPPQ